MAKLAEMLSIEQDRPDKLSWMKVHLFRDGRFLRAFEASAWHCVRLCGNAIAVAHRKSPQAVDGSFVTIGFPPESIAKFTPKGAIEDYKDDINSKHQDMKKKLLFITVLLLLSSVGSYAEQVTLTLYANGCAAANVITCPKDYELRVTAETDSGYHFVRWSDGNTDNPRMVSPSSDMTLTAMYAADDVTLTLYANGCAAANVITCPKDYTIRVTAETDSGYHFVRWSDGNTDNPRMVSPSSDMTLTAMYAADDVTLTLYANGCEAPNVITCPKDYTIRVTAETDSGYHFVRWSDGDTINPRVVEVSENTTLTAEFEQDMYTIQVSSNNDELGSVTGGGNIALGTTVTLTATPTDNCSRFVAWNDGDTNATRTITVTGAATYVATFERIQYTITVTSDNESQGSVTIQKVSSEPVVPGGGPDEPGDVAG